MKQVTSNSRTSIQWSLTEQPEDLDFADDLALLTHAHHQMQEKSCKLETTAAALELKINTHKTKIMQINNKNVSPITMDQQQLEEVVSFTYTGSIITIDGGTDEEVKVNSNVKSIFVYASETWKITTKIADKIQVFLNCCLRRLLGIIWPKCQPVGTHQTRNNRKADEEEEMELDRPYTQKTQQLHKKAGSNVEPTRQEEERKT